MAMNTSISAYIPCFNNEETVVQAIRSIKEQTVPVAEVFLVDDFSTDNSVALAKEEGISVIKHELTEGRGAVRKTAMLHATHELVLSCDAGIVLAPDFVERSLTWLQSDKVAAVHGRVLQASPRNAAERWRGRHLFKIDAQLAPSQQSSLLTGGAIVRKSIVLNLGNYDARLLFGEDKDLGDRLLNANYDVVFDPEMKMTAVTRNNLRQVLERYGRWNATYRGRLGWLGYGKLIVYSIKVMAQEDLKVGDWPSALISLICPHYQFWSLYNCESILDMEPINSANFKAQFGEDKLLLKHFAGKKYGFYVEVGALDGVYVSNTFLFEQIGWHGVLVEPIPEAAKKCAQARPASQVVCCAAVAPNTPCEIEFEVVEGWEALSAPSLNRERLHEYKPQVRKITVAAKTLDTILQEANVKRIDFLTIDVEGHEWAVLQGFTIDHWRPEIVIIERWGALPDKNIMQYMHENNYVYRHTTGGLNDWFYRTNSEVSRSLSYRLSLFLRLYLPAYGLYKAKMLTKALLKMVGF